MIDAAMIGEALGVTAPVEARFRQLGALNSEEPATLSFIESARYLPQLHANPNVTGIFVTPVLSPQARVSHRIVCNDPRGAFFRLHNWRAAKIYVTRPTVIDPTATIDPSAYVAGHNVVVGPGCTVQARAVVLPDVFVGANSVIGVNTVVGCDDAEVKRTSEGLLKVVHDGRLILGERVEIGANCTIDKGFSGRDTEIGCGTKLANATYVGHSARIGRNCMLLGCTVLGSAVIGDDVRINPGAIISNQVRVASRAEVSLGAIVVQHVPEGTRVTGNFAMEHQRFLYRYSKVFGPF